MMFQLLEDLRFVIGFFFGIVGIFLLGLGFFAGEADLNVLAGSAMAVFAFVMIGLSVLAVQK